MRRLVSILLAGLLVLAGLVLASTAQAAPDVRQPRLVGIETFTYVGPTRLVSRTALATEYCKTVAKRVVGHSYFGIDIWWFQQRLSWCYEIRGAGGQVQRWITRATPKCAGTTYGITNPAGIGWEFKGYVDCQYAGGVGTAYDFVKRYRKGHFAYCPGVCVQHFFPYAWVLGRSDGTWARGGGGAP